MFHVKTYIIRVRKINHGWKSKRDLLENFTTLNESYMIIFIKVKRVFGVMSRETQQNSII